MGSFIKTYSKYITIVLFLVLIIIPNIVMVINPQYENNKFSNFKSFPKFSFSNPIKSIGMFKKFYLQNFGLKDVLVDSYINLKKNKLNENPIPVRAIEGKGNWFFLGNHYNNVIDDSFGISPLSKIELHIMEENLLKLKDYFDQKKIDFYLVIPPNKNTIYKEYLPFKIDQREKKIDQFKSFIKKNNTVKIINLTESIESKKDSILLYYKTDSHWNDSGAYIGYSEVINQLNLRYNIPKTSLSNYSTHIDYFQGDITDMINNNLKEKALRFTKKNDSNVEVLNDDRTYLKYINRTKSLSLLVYRDSFSNNWVKFFNETFNRTVFLRDYTINEKIIDVEKPDIVIMEIAERNFDVILKKMVFSN